MSNYDNNNTGALFKNDRKQTEKHPDYTGKCEINNVGMYMSAWIKTGQSGKKFMSFSFNPIEVQAPKPAQAQDNSCLLYTSDAADE